MDHEVGPWKMAFFHGPNLFLFLFFDIINQFAKLLDLSQGVNLMWTKRNDYVPKGECVELKIYICPKGHFWKKKNESLTILLSLEGIVSISAGLATRPLRLAPKKCINKSIWLATGGAPSMGTPRVPSGCQPNWFVYAFSHPWVAMA